MTRSADHRVDVDADFARFAKDGDVDALGRVFDGCAARLLVVARSLAGDEAAAEDLVQSTFLAALRGAARWHAGRPVIAWLLGILAKEAAAQRRAGTRRQQRETDAGATRVERPGPAQQAELVEVAERVGGALQGLPAEYRQVLNLRLLHGLQPMEIARALERPQGTVRSQLQRGLQMLRQALPAGVALPAALVTAGGSLGAQELAALRARVLGAAREQVLVASAANGLGVTSWLTVIGGIGMAKVWLLAVVGCGVVVLGLMVAPFAMDGAAGRGEPVRAGSGGSAAADVVHADREASPERSTTPPRLAVAPVVVRGDAVVRGRLVDEDGVPLADLPVKVRMQGADDVRGRSDPQGRFALAVPPQDESRRPELCAAGGRLPRRFVELGALRADEVRDLGDVVVWGGAEVRGVVREADGTPRAEAAVVARLVRPRAARWQGVDRLLDGGRSDSDGRFTINQPCVVGDHRIEVLTDGKLVTQQFRVESGQTEVVVAIEVPDLEPRVTLGGVLVDETGAPIAGAELGLGSPYGCRTNADGRFRVETLESRRDSPSVRVLHCRAEGHESLRHAFAASDWGRDDLRLVMRRGITLDVLVLDGEGLPVVDHHLRVFPVTGHGLAMSPEQLRARFPGPHPDGRTCVGPLQRGAWWLQAVCADGSRTELRRIELGGQGVQAVTLSLSSPVALRVRVVNEDGVGVAGAELAVLHSLSDSEPGLRTPVVDLDGEEHMIGHPLAARLDGAVTGRGGAAELAAPAGSVVALRVVAPGHPPKLVSVAPWPDTAGVLEVGLDPAAELRVRVGPPNAVTEVLRQSKDLPASLRLCDPAGTVLVLDPRLLGVRGQCVPLTEAMSEVRFTGVPPGDWDVQLVTWTGSPLSVGGNQRVESLVRVHALGAGESRAVDVDLGDLAEVDLQGVVLRGGQPVAGKTVHLTRAGGAGGQERRVTTDSRGRFLIGLRRGSWTLELVRLGPGLQLIREPATPIVEIAGPGPVEQTFELAGR